MFLLGAAFLYGLGEAMRSGTHKAMVLLWLQRHDLMRCKSYLYGRTRSWSLIGAGNVVLFGAILLIIKMIVLPRQARDKHIANAEKTRRLFPPPAGSGVSAVLSIFIMLLVQRQQENIFLFSILPYLADLLMVCGSKRSFNIVIYT
eukprot:COSAG06_NODE_6134_length_3091_cov_392.779937_4_plen_146_part_00